MDARARSGRSEHSADLDRILWPLSRVAEIFALSRTAVNLLNTYVGRWTGERVLSGKIVRGDMDTIRCALWFSDLRDFTSLAAQLGPGRIVGALSELFDCEVAYGNIGGAGRLDFTCIGPAVNLAARLEGLTGRLQRRTVVSAEFRAQCSAPLASVGSYQLKGVSGVVEAFSLAE